MQAAVTPLSAFHRAQAALNRFMWTSDLAYALVLDKRVLDDYSPSEPAWSALEGVVAQAWFPNRAGDVHYRGTIEQLRRDVGRNLRYVQQTVPALFITAFEVYVTARFPRALRAWRRGQTGGSYKPVPRPVDLVSVLSKHAQLSRVDPQTVLRADLMKEIRNSVIHRGRSAAPRRVTEVQGWVSLASRRGYSRTLAAAIAEQAIEGATKAVSIANKEGRRLPRDHMYMLYTFTAFRDLADALDAAGPDAPYSRIAPSRRDALLATASVDHLREQLADQGP